MFGFGQSAFTVTVHLKSRKTLAIRLPSSVEVNAEVITGYVKTCLGSSTGYLTLYNDRDSLTAAWDSVEAIQIQDY